MYSCSMIQNYDRMKIKGIRKKILFLLLILIMIKMKIQEINNIINNSIFTY